MYAKFYFKLKLKNPFIMIKTFLDERIKRAVNRELSNIFRKQGSVAVDHHFCQDSWAVIKVDTGDGSCYLKFIDLGKKDLKEIQEFLKKFERSRIDSAPYVMKTFDRMYDMFD